MRWRLSGGFLLLTLAGLLAASELLAWRLIIIPEKKDADELIFQLMADHEQQVLQITSAEGLLLEAVHLLPHQPDTLEARGTIVLLHGVGSCKGALSPQADWLLDQGFQVIMLDQRAHGKSEGAYCTFGFHERDDVSLVLDWLDQHDAATPYGVYGISMGGSVAAMSLAHDQRLRFGMIQSTFTDFRDIVLDYQQNMFGLKVPFLADRALSRAAAKADFDPAEVAPLQAASSFSVPVFISHGTADDDISADYGRQLYEAAPLRKKTFYPVKGADHLNWWEVGGEDYKAALSRFLKESTEAVGRGS